MSSWVGDWEAALIPKRPKADQKGGRKREDIYCKLGQHRVPPGVDVVWLSKPLGLSCVPCATENGWTPPTPDPVAAPVPKPRTRKPTKARTPKDPGPMAAVVPSAPVDPDAWRTDPTHWRHGKKWTYDHHKCRCQPCTTAGTTAGNERRKRQRARLAGVAA